MRPAFLFLAASIFLTSLEHSISSKLDESIQRYAFQRLAPLPRTGVIYNVTLPESLQPMVNVVQAVRLRSGSLRRHGLQLNEFTIPVQSLVETTSKYVVLIYRSLNAQGDSVVPGYTLVAPVLGIRSYDANDLSESSVSEFSIFSGSAPVTVRFPRKDVETQCVFFDKAGGLTFANTSSSSGDGYSTCILGQLVDSSLVIPGSGPTPAPALPPALPPTARTPEVPPTPVSSRAGNIRIPSRSSSWKLGIGLAVGVIGFVILLWFLTSCFVKARHKAHLANMQYYADNSETLQTALIAGSRAPAAAATRTKPVLENDYVANV